MEFPKAILHVDGDAFFVSCELTRRPDLRGRPVVTGEERGIATAVNQPAKKLGVVRGMRTHDIRRNFPSVIILPSDYVMYAQYARRMYAIVRRYAGEDRVEEYSIDECFADLTGLAGDGARAANGASYPSYEALAAAIQADLYSSLGITFSVGLGVNKVMAKAASKWRKPFGLTVIPRGAIRDFLKDLPVGKVWGIGSATTVYLRKLGLATALDLAGQSRAWVAEHCDRPLAEIYEEFQGNYVKKLDVVGGSVVGFGGADLGGNASSGGSASRMPGSIQQTRTFYPPVATRPCDRDFLWSQISHHLEDACVKLRSKGLVAARAFFFVKTSAFEYIRGEAILPDAAAAAQEILKAIAPEFEKIWKRSGGLFFRAAGICLSDLKAEGAGTQPLFAATATTDRSSTIHRAVDRLSRRFGRHAVFLGSSFKALKAEGGLTSQRKPRAFDVIYLGEVR